MIKKIMYAKTLFKTYLATMPKWLMACTLLLPMGTLLLIPWIIYIKYIKKDS